MFKDENKRMGALAIIWGVFGIITCMLIFFGDASFITIAILAGAAMITTLNIRDSGDDEEVEQGKAKRGRDNDEVAALLNLLDDDDRDILKERIRARLLDRIDRAGDGELSSLDALLAEHESASRRAER